MFDSPTLQSVLGYFPRGVAVKPAGKLEHKRKVPNSGHVKGFPNSSVRFWALEHSKHIREVNFEEKGF